MGRKEIDLSELPKRGSLKIKWSESIGYDVKFTYDEIQGNIKIIQYDLENQCLIVKYNNNEFTINIGQFINCKIGKIVGKITKEFKIEIGTRLKDDKRDITITDREYRKDKNGVYRKWYKYTCNICGWTEGWMAEGSLIGKQRIGCSCCAGRTAVLGINTIWDTNRWMCDLGVSEEDAKSFTKSSHVKIQTICPNCGKVKYKKINYIYNEKSIGCSCGDKISYPNKFMTNLLCQLNIYFETEYNPEWIKPSRYDFYIPLMNLIIEMDGSWHKSDNKLSGQTAEESRAIDNYKDEQARLHGIKVIRIDCEKSELEYIKNNVIKSRLNKLFDLYKINWLRAEEFACSNLIKIACEYKNNNPFYTTSEIGKLMGFCCQTISKWLKKGNELKWCHYNVKEEIKRIGKMNCKPVEIFKDGISLGIFESGTDLERQSEKLFSTKLSQKQISKVCKGIIKQYKGFTFKYIKEVDINGKSKYKHRCDK